MTRHFHVCTLQWIHIIFHFKSLFSFWWPCHLFQDSLFRLLTPFGLIVRLDKCCPLSVPAMLTLTIKYVRIRALLTVFRFLFVQTIITVVCIMMTKWWRYKIYLSSQLLKDRLIDRVLQTGSIHSIRCLCSVWAVTTCYEKCGINSQQQQAGHFILNDTSLAVSDMMTDPQFDASAQQDNRRSSNFVVVGDTQRFLSIL